MSKEKSTNKTEPACEPSTPSTVKTKVFGAETQAKGEVNKKAALEDAGRL